MLLVQKFALKTVNIGKQDIGTSLRSAYTACKSLKLTLNLKLRNWPSLVQVMKIFHLFDQNCETFLMFQLKVPIIHD